MSEVIDCTWKCALRRYVPYNSQAAELTIEQQHEAVLSCCDRLLRAAISPELASQIPPIRMQLAGLLRANLAAEEAQLLAPLRSLPVSQRPMLFAKLTAEAARLRAAYSDHIRKWDVAMITADPSGYAKDAVSLVERVRSHVVEKRTVLPQWKRAARQQIES